MGNERTIGAVEEIDGWYVYCVGVDDGRLYQPLSKLGTGNEVQALQYIPDKNQMSTLETALKKIGWEGDGTIMYVALPPCFSIDEASSAFWFPAFFVRQPSNGISFIASLTRLSIAEDNVFVYKDKRLRYSDSNLE
jgi:hypothetical protein